MDVNEPGLSFSEVVVAPGKDVLGAVSAEVGTDPDMPRSDTSRRLAALDLNRLLIQNPNSTFLFRIRGHQGITQGILHGDIAVVDHGTAPRSQDLVLWHDGTRFKLSRPTRIADQAQVWGTITAVIHQYRDRPARKRP